MKYLKWNPGKGLLMVSGLAFFLLNTPAWAPTLLFSGLFAAAAAAVLLMLDVSCGSIRTHCRRPGSLAAALLLCSLFGCNFYNTWVTSSALARVAGLLHLTPGMLAFLSAAAITLAAVPAAAWVTDCFARHIGREWQALRPSGKKGMIPAHWAAAILFLIFVLGISAILRANYYYNDDLERTAHGYKLWDNYSRYLSNAFSTWLHMGNYLTDTAPLPQLAAAAVLALAGTVILYAVCERREFTVWEILAMVSVGLNPYFLECFSYRFDAPYMALSVLFAAAPLLLRRAHPAVYILAGVMGMAAVCTSYQAAAGIFPMLVILIALRMWNRKASGRELAAFILRSAAGFCIGILYFRLALMKPFETYVSSSMPSAVMMIPTAIRNLFWYYGLILLDFKPVWLLLAVLIFAAAVFRTVSGSSRNRWAAAGMTLAAFAAMAALSFGIYILLNEPVIAPRAMYGFGVLLALLSLTAVEGTQGKRLALPVVILGWIFLVFAFTYGNALHVQAEYSDFRIRQLIADLNDLEPLAAGQPRKVQISGSTGQSPILRNMPRNYRMLNRLVPASFGDSSEWAYYGLFYYYDLPGFTYDTSLDLRNMELPLMSESMYQSIYGNDEYLLVVLHTE